MQTLHVMSVAANRFLGFGDDIEQIGGRVDHGSAGDADLRANVAGVKVGAGDRANGRGAEGIVHVARRIAGIQKRALPEDGAASGSRVDRVEAVVLGCGKDDGMHASRPGFGVDAIRDGDAGIDQRLGIDLPI